MTPLTTIDLSPSQVRSLLLLSAEGQQPRYRIKCSGRELSMLREEGLVSFAQDREMWVHITSRGQQLIQLS